MLKAIDVSNLQGHPDTWASQPWYPNYLAADAVIVQAIEPPPRFIGHDFIDPETSRRGYTGVALRRAKADGKKVGAYVWLWNTLADVAGDIAARLATVPPSVALDMRPWVDVEDTSACSLDQRKQAILAARAAADAWAASHGLPPSGGYSGDWYVTGYLGGWWPDGWLYWVSDYNAAAGSRLRPMAPMHQFTSSPVDSSVLLETEIVPSPHPEEDVQIPQDYVDKFHLTGPSDITGLIANFEGVITTVRQLALAEGEADSAAAVAKLEQIRQVVEA